MNCEPVWRRDHIMFHMISMEAISKVNVLGLPDVINKMIHTYPIQIVHLL